jgi:hypothetical protein
MKQVVYIAAIIAVFVSLAINATLLAFVYENRFAASSAALDAAALYATQKEIKGHIAAIDARDEGSTKLLAGIYWRTCNKP